MLDQITRTGSISQDALRLGFQTTCNAGLEVLFKVDDITTEQCQAFKERHNEDVERALDGFIKRTENKLIKDFENKMTYEFGTDYLHPLQLVAIWRVSRRNKFINSQPLRNYAVVIDSVSEPTLDIINGLWETYIHYKVTADAWEGFYYREWQKFKKETYKETQRIYTPAKKCKVKYTPYDDYNERYIPDEATAVALEAKQIGMHDLVVAQPILEDGKVPNLDPIIVAHVGEQMFMIVWFGYNTDDHMACNI